MESTGRESTGERTERNATTPVSEPSSPAHRRNVYWFTTQMMLRCLFSIYMNYRARGFEKIASGGGLLLVNHQSFIDPVVIGLPLDRPISFLARDSLFRVPIFGSYLRRMYAMPISREAAGTASIRQALDRLQQGYLVGIFPEGTRTRDGRLGEIKPGFVTLVRRGGVPVYPVGIAGAFDALPRSSFWLRPRPIRVVFGAPFTDEELAGNAREITATAEARLSACLEEAESWLRGRQHNSRGEEQPTQFGSALRSPIDED